MYVLDTYTYKAMDRPFIDLDNIFEIRNNIKIRAFVQKSNIHSSFLILLLSCFG